MGAALVTLKTKLEAGMRLIILAHEDDTRSVLTLCDAAETEYGLICTVLTAVQCVLLHICGMGWFDALCHAFSTLGTGGFSTRNGSIAAFASPSIEWVTTVFMFLGTVNFGIHYLLVAGRWKDVWNSSEFRGFVGILLVSVAVVTLVEFVDFGSLEAAIRLSAFQVISLISTTGFTSCDYTTWRPTAQLLLPILFLIGGCSGSTAGGIKVIRWVVLAKGLHKDILQMIHPRGVFAVRIDGRPVGNGLSAMVGSFVYVYFAFVVVTALCGTLCGQGVCTAFTLALAMVGNVGAAFGALGPSASFAGEPDALKFVY